MKIINIGILNAPLNSNNMGCNALTFSAIHLLMESADLLNFIPRFTLFTRGDSAGLEIYPELSKVDIQFVEPVLTIKSKIKRLIVDKSITAQKKMNKALDACDMVFEISGGDSFSDIYGVPRLRGACAMHKVIKRKKKPLILLPQTIGPFESRKAVELARSSLTYASCVFARDPVSHKKAMEFISGDKLQSSIDMAFFMEYYPIDKTKDDKLCIGLNPSGLLWNNGYTGKNEFGLVADYKELIYSIIELLNELDIKVVLIGHDIQGPAYDLGDDYRVCKLLKKKYPFCEIAPFFYTPMEAKSYLSNLDLLIGARMHCCIGAYSSGVPVFPLAYSRKFRGLFKEELGYPYGAELVLDEKETIIRGLRSMINLLSDIQEAMSEQMQRMEAYKKRLVNDLKGAIESAIS